MKRSMISSMFIAGVVLTGMLFAQEATTESVTPAAKPKAAKTAVAKSATTAPAKSIKADTLVITGRITEIPGKFPPNDLYNYVYIMKYRVLSVVKGKYAGQEILVGVYNPLIARNQIKDKMAKLALGDALKFEEGAQHKLTLLKPIEAVWKDAVEDEYFDSELAKYYALRVDIAK
jgi:hypothetical protein